MQGLEIFSTSWFLAIGVVFLAALIRGVTGFGFALVFAPLMLLLMQPKAVVPTNLLLSLLSNIVVLTFSFRQVNLRRLLPMIVGSLMGIPIGIFIITIISAVILKILIGGVVVFFAILLVLKVTPRFSNEKLVSGFAGFLSGVLTSSTSLGGPPVVLFMHTQSWEKNEIHPSLAAYFLFSTLASIIGLSISGMVTTGILLTAASLAPVLVIGVALGMQAFKRVNERYFRMISVAVVIATGILAVLSGLGIMK
jgi:uncharacterized membrane protein YfcA